MFSFKTAQFGGKGNPGSVTLLDIQELDHQWNRNYVSSCDVRRGSLWCAEWHPGGPCIFKIAFFVSNLFDMSNIWSLQQQKEEYCGMLLIMGS
jgi:hypothetical protein